VDEVPIILVVEHDSAIQALVEDALTEGGFQPAIAGSAEEAVTLLQGGQTNYRALVINVSLNRGMDGWEAARKARQINPNFPIIYITAGAGNEWPSQGVPNSILLQKPFALAQLVIAVSQLLTKGATLT
jgi:DNA-binding response OmpR family regulator